MWYVIEGRDAPDALEHRRGVRAAHLARLELLRDQGRLLLAGACPAIDAADPGPAGFSGSVVVAEFGSVQEAREWADGDPYLEAGVYSGVEVRPFNRVLP
ncbi:YciI family protein [Lysobacter sp. GX 14042]|uniref:YciI family protein n=1 Tax=Lysobacter sp. GX 14042 TaxID=2907155 RepID=UPI001F36CA8A|nr:YciI family protein [Lysobacter sp. GX 14042]MCE7031238.1 YciI family protein [Lysobacter sp. GX 14042]